LKGSKLRIVSYLASVIVQRKNLPFKIWSLRVTDLSPHNGCKLKIKKRRRNKGVNKWAKRQRKFSD
jgi:hypothetical protein